MNMPDQVQNLERQPLAGSSRPKWTGLKLGQLRGLRAMIVGAAREGTALARYLVERGATVTLADAKPASALAKHLAALQGVNVRLALGVQTPDLNDVDVLFLSPGVPPTAQVVQQARARGIPLSSEPRMVTQLLAAPIVGITGSSGKTTTTALTGEIYAAAGRCTWVGGNIGFPLIEKMLSANARFDAEQPDVAVMELSSFQLELFAPDYQGAEVEQKRSPASRAISVQGWSPHIAAITNITPNHLDRHPSMQDYVRAKSIILAYQYSDDWAVLNAEDNWTRTLVTHGQVLQFSLEHPVEAGAYLDGDRLVSRYDGRERELCKIGEVKLRGRHNLANILTASCCALAGGVPCEAIREGATTFTGVAHRQEVVRQLQGVTWVNDSIATTPERAMAALRLFGEMTGKGPHLVLLAGGRDKHLPWDEWANLVRAQVRAVVAFGEAASIIEAALGGNASGCSGQNGPALYRVATLDDAVARAAEIAQPEDVVLLSPGGTSFDAFEDFEARGERFRELVAALSQ